MKGLNRISCLFFISLSIIICLASAKLGIGKIQDPGSGFMPFITSSLLLCLSVVVLIKDLIGLDKDKGQLVVRKNLQKPISLVVSLFGYTFLLNFFGYLITTFLLIFLMFLICDFNPRRWWKDLITAAIATILSFIIFYRWFEVQLPVGVFHIGF